MTKYVFLVVAALAAVLFAAIFPLPSTLPEEGKDAPSAIVPLAPALTPLDGMPGSVDRFTIVNENLSAEVEKAECSGWENGSPCDWNGHDAGPVATSSSEVYEPDEGLLTAVAIALTTPGGSTTLGVDVTETHPSLTIVRVTVTHSPEGELSGVALLSDATEEALVEGE